MRFFNRACLSVKNYVGTLLESDEDGISGQKTMPNGRSRARLGDKVSESEFRLFPPAGLRLIDLRYRLRGEK